MDASGARRAVLHRDGGEMMVRGAGRAVLHLEPLKTIARGAGMSLLHLAKMPLPEYATSGSYCVTGTAAAQPLSAAVATQPRESQYWGNYSLPQTPKLPNALYTGAQDYRPLAIVACRSVAKRKSQCDLECIFPSPLTLKRELSRWDCFWPTCSKIAAKV